MSSSLWINALILVPLLMLWATIPTDALALISDYALKRTTDILLDLPFSRMLETEADEVGIQLMAKVMKVWYLKISFATLNLNAGLF